MNRPHRHAGFLVAMAVMATTGVMAATPALADTGGPPGSFTVVAGHLSNPRGLSPAPGGGLYLAEAGSGGQACAPGGPEGETCFGLTGSLDRVTITGGQGVVNRVVSGLASASAPGGLAAEGPVSVSARPGGMFYAQFGLSSHAVPPQGVIAPDLREAALSQLGHLIWVKRDGSVRDVSDVGDQDWTWTSTRVFLAPNDFPDANPNAVLYSHGHIYVVDAGANTLVEVSRSGAVKVLAFFPTPPGSQSDSVPTCIAQGPDGAFYVAELLGGSYAPGGARVWRVVPGHEPAVWATGLTAVQGCGFGRNGAFYATEFQVNGFDLGPTGNPAGAVVRIAPDGTRTQLGVGELFYPSGFAAGPNGTIYVSNCSIAPATGITSQLCSGGGQLVRLAG